LHLRGNGDGGDFEESGSDVDQPYFGGNARGRWLGGGFDLREFD